MIQQNTSWPGLCGKRHDGPPAGGLRVKGGIPGEFAATASYDAAPVHFERFRTWKCLACIYRLTP